MVMGKLQVGVGRHDLTIIARSQETQPLHSGCYFHN